jgi:tRNA threonylcarbamoyladenosine biosynthesis protein TsaB
MTQSVALLRDGVLVDERVPPESEGHGRTLATTLVDLLTKNHLELRDVQQLVVGAGPGSFTGLRIGLAFARGIGLALGVPVLLRCSLRAVAVRPASTAAYVAVALDARRGEVYSAVFASGPRLREVVAPAARRPSEFAAAIDALAGETYEVRGDGFSRYMSEFAAVCATAQRVDFDARPTGAGVAVDAGSAADAPAVDNSEEPTYLRDADAELTTKSPRWLLPAR